MAAPSSSSTADLSRVAPYLYLSAAITIVAGIALGFAVTPALFGLVVIGVVDGVLAYAFSNAGRTRPDPAAPSDAAAAVEADPSYNPYARED